MKRHNDILKTALLALIGGAPTQHKAPEPIGRCDLCGLVDHHLVAGVCSGCRSKFAIPEEEAPHV